MGKSSRPAPIRNGQRVGRLIITATRAEWMGVENWTVTVLITLFDGREWQAQESIDGWKDVTEAILAVGAGLRVWETYSEGTWTEYRTCVSTALLELQSQPF